MVFVAACYARNRCYHRIYTDRLPTLCLYKSLINYQHTIFSIRSRLHTYPPKLHEYLRKQRTYSLNCN
jgi:hypothetical protein